MLDWIAAGTAVAALAVPLARRYASKRVNRIVDAFALGEDGDGMSAEVKKALAAAAESQLRAAFDHLAAEADGLLRNLEPPPMASALRDLLAQRDAAIETGKATAIAEHNARLSEQASSARRKALTTSPRSRKR